MKVTAPEGVFLPALGRPVDKGEEIDVADDVGASLVEQGWKQAKATKAAPKTAAAEQED